MGDRVGRAGGDDGRGATLITRAAGCEPGGGVVNLAFSVEGLMGAEGLVGRGCGRRGAGPDGVGIAVEAGRVGGIS